MGLNSGAGPHAASHENGGADEVDATGLDGVGGGASGFVTDSTTGAKLDTGRSYVAGQAGSAADAYIYLNGGVDVTAFDSLIGLYPAAGYPVWVDGDGVVLAKLNSSPTPYDQGQIYTDNADFSNQALRPRFWNGSDWLHLMTGSGWMPYAFPIGYAQDGVYTTALDLAANHDTVAIPFMLTAPMHVSAVQFWNTDTSLAREVEVALWHQPHGLNATNDKLLVKVEASQEFGSWTASAASLRGVSYSSGVIVPAGLVWLTIKNIHASNTLGVGYAAGSTQMPINLAQQKVLGATSFDGTTLDFVAATWTKLTNVHAAVLRGKVFGQTTAF